MSRIIFDFSNAPCNALINKPIVIWIVAGFVASEWPYRVNKCAKNCIGWEGIYPTRYCRETGEMKI
jgi:hypothetical protein